MRDLNKVIASYYEKFGTPADKFFASDLYQVRDMAMKNISKGWSEVLYTAIESALNAGFMIGYNAGQRAARKKRKKAA